MFLRTVWYWFCILIFFDGLFDLFETKNQVFFKSEPKNLSGPIKISVCLQIDSTLYNCSNLTDPNLSICNRLKAYFRYIESKEKKSPKDIILKFDEFELPTLFSINNTEKKYSYLNLRSFCTLYELNNYEIKKGDFFLTFNFYNNYQLTVKLFLYFDLIPRFQRYEYLKCINFKKCFYFTLSGRIFEKFSLQSPFETDCSNYTDEFYFKKFEKINSKTNCIQECFKNRYRFPEFYYTENDTDLLNFNQSENYGLLDVDLIRDCQNQCSMSTCKSKYFEFFELSYKKTQNYVKFRINSISASAEAVPILDSLGFARKFLGFLSLFFKISILSLTLKSIKILKSKTDSPGYLNKSKRIAISLISILLWTFLVSSFFYGSFLVTFIYDEFNKTASIPNFYETQHFKPTNFTIAICKSVKASNNNFENTTLSNLETPAKCFNSTEQFKVKFGKYEMNLKFLNGKFLNLISNQF